ncbi:MAG TPA: hypothetical protein VFZ61_03940 [Polyangiales bacterium]
MQAFFESRPDFPRPLGPTLQSGDLCAADVLLSRGHGPLSDCIVAADGGSYSHAALWSGSGVIEAREDGVRERPLDGERDAYRFHADGRTLDAGTAARVIAFARGKVGGGYAFHELYLLGALFALGVTPGRSLARMMLDALGGGNADRLESWLNALEGRRAPVICTELVALAFYEASPDRVRALRVLPVSARPQAPGSPSERSWSAAPEVDAEMLSFQARCRTLISSRPTAVPDQFERQRKLAWGSVALQAHSDRRLSVVTPADLQFSPSLKFMGRAAASG